MLLASPIRKAIPLNINIAPKVVIKGFISSLVIIKPMHIPIVIPIKREIKIAIKNGTLFTNNIPRIIPIEARTDPADKSKPPDINNIVIPAAIIELTETLNSILLKFCTDKKESVFIPAIVIIMRITIIRIDSLLKKSFFNILDNKFSP